MESPEADGLRVSEVVCNPHEKMKAQTVNLGGALNAINLSPDKQSLAAVGREVLKIVSLSEDGLKEVLNLRVGKVNLNFSSVDVKWHPMEQHRDIIATAATNGAVVVWNISGTGGHKQERVITDHTRTVNRISWHPQHAYTLLSASQDGTMKLWDIRDPANCSVTFDGKSEAVRDVIFSPHHINYFASAFDNGTVQIWDIRKPASYERKFTAHQGPVFCIDWHPDERTLLATGGRDRFIQVWDMNSQHKPAYTIQTVSSVSHIHWRPGEKLDISSLGLVDFKVHLWTLKKPFIPYAVFELHQDVVTDIQWLANDKLLSCGKDSIVSLQSTTDCTRPYKHIRTVGLGWTPRDELAVLSDKINRNAHEQLMPITVTSSASLTNLLSIFDQSQNAVDTQPKGIMKFFHNQEVSDGGFSVAAFEYFANKYLFNETKHSFAQMCEHNSKVASEVSYGHVSQAWTWMKLFYENERPFAQPAKGGAAASLFSPRSNHREIPRKSPSFHNIPIAKTTGMSNSLTSLFESEPGFSLDLASMQQPDSFNLSVTALPSDQFGQSDLLATDVSVPLGPLSMVIEEKEGLPPPAPPPKALQSNIRSGLFVDDNFLQDERNRNFGVIFQDELRWDCGNMMEEMLEFYAENGDVQTTVIMLLVLGDRISINPDKKRVWFAAYIELLHRLQLWCHANEIIKKSTSQEVRQVNQTSTTLHTSCPHCSKPLMSLGWLCETCKKPVNPCSLCHQPVKGLYVWCQGCGHGGHLAHLATWFSSNNACPTGCGHKCNFGQSLPSSTSITNIAELAAPTAETVS